MSPRTTSNRTSSQRRPGTPASQQHGSHAGFSAACVAVVALVVVYCLGCVFFYQRFWPNTVIGDANVSLMKASAAEASLQDASNTRSVTVSGQGVSFTLTGANAGLELNVEAAVDTALGNTAFWQWPVQLFLRHDNSDALSTSFDNDLLRATIEGNLSAFNSMASDPSDAFLYFDTASQLFQINPGSMGTKLDIDSVMQTVIDALTARRDHAPLTSANLVQQNVRADDERIIAARDAANAYLSCNIDLTVGDQVATTVNPAVVKDWICVGDDFSVWLDDAKLVAWVDALEDVLDTVGDTRTYTRPDGKVVTVTGGSYGWISDGNGIEQIIYDAIYNGTTGQVAVPFHQTADHYNPGGADWGLHYVDVDLTEQHAYFYDWDGSLVADTDIISGSTAEPGRATPEGVYYITYKMTDQTLIGLPDPETGEPKYETHVDYWMPFIGNMVGLHDAPWQSSFGGSLYTTLSGSHGCINLPPSVAQWAYYNYISVGDVVITHY